MQGFLRFLDQFPLSNAILIAVTLGLAPFTPQPHVVEKLGMLAAGTLARPIDIFDLALHGVPWLLLFIKLGRIGYLTTRAG
ncbi:MAG: RND transporter [Maritimibacter sp.]